MSRPRPHRRLVVAIPRLLIAVAVLAVGASMVAPVASGAPRQGPDLSPPSVRLTFQPDTASPDGEFPVLLTVEGAPAGSELSVDIYGRVTDDTAIDEPVAEGSEATFNRVPLTGSEAAQQAGFTIVLYHRGTPRPATPWAYRIDRAGVYPLVVRLRSNGNDTLSTLTTHLVRLPAAGESTHQAQVAVMATVHQAPAADPEDPKAPPATDPAGWRALDSLLEGLQDHPSLAASFAVTPETASRLAAAPGAQTRFALAGLRRELQGARRELLDGPFVEIDPAGLVGAGLAEELTRQRDLGRATLTEVLEPPTVGIWPLPRPVSVDGLRELRARGIFRAVLSPSAFPGPAPQAPVALPAGDGPLRAITLDPGPGLGTGRTADPVLTAHRFLAGVAAGATNASADTAVVASVDTASIDAAALKVVLDALSLGTPYYRDATVNELFDRVPTVPGPVLAPPADPNLGGYPDQAREVQASLVSYASMVIDRPDLVARLDRLLAVSAAVDLPLDDRRQRLGQVESTLQGRFRAVSAPVRDKVTLGARVGRFPVPVRSELTYPVRVLVELATTDRLSVRSDPFLMTLTGDRTVAQVRVRSRASGDAPLRVTIRSPDGRVVLAETRYTVRSTAVSGVGVLLTLGAAAFLALWWGRHWFHHRRRAPQV